VETQEPASSDSVILQHPSSDRQSPPADSTGLVTSPAATGDTSIREDADASATTDDSLREREAELIEKLRPLAIAAENAAGRAVDISVRELTRLSGYLERRRQQRAEPSTDDQAGADPSTTG
jgi:hypothetical protein